jgi:hypothetical protein
MVFLLDWRNLIASKISNTIYQILDNIFLLEVQYVYILERNNQRPAKPGQRNRKYYTTCWTS